MNQKVYSSTFTELTDNPYRFSVLLKRTRTFVWPRYSVRPYLYLGSDLHLGLTSRHPPSVCVPAPSFRLFFRVRGSGCPSPPWRFWPDRGWHGSKVQGNYTVRTDILSLVLCALPRKCRRYGFEMYRSEEGFRCDPWTCRSCLWLRDPLLDRNGRPRR